MGYTRTAIKSFGWLGAFKFYKRGLGYVRIAILARILTPEQFGVFGVASLVLALLEILTETGINTVLIQQKDKVERYINTAWVISIFRGFLIGMLILASAGYVSEFFESPSSYRLLVGISLVPVIRGFINPAIINYRKELRFDKDFLINTLIYTTESAIILLVGILYKTEMAFVYGLIAGVIVEVIYTHIFLKTKPKFKINPKIAKNILKRGSWVTLSGITNYVNTQGDDAIVGKLASVSQLGIYQSAYKISTLPLTEVSFTINSVNFPVYTKFADDVQRIRRAFLKTFKFSLLAIFAIGIVMFVFSRELVLLVLGDQWLEAIPVLRALSIFGILTAINAAPNSVFLALKRQDLIAKLHIIQLAVMLLTIIPLVNQYQALGAAFSIVISNLVALPITYISLYSLLRLPHAKKKA